VLLVDDKQSAKDRLRQLLRPFEDVEVVGEAADGEQAMEQILELRPDVVFLDIQMPGCSGIDVAASLPAPRPGIIFCTAFDQYAIDAFELHAVDYLLKPVTRARLAKALERVRGLSSEDGETRLSKVRQFAGKPPARFLAKHANKYRVVPQEEVQSFISEEGLTKLCTRDAAYWMQPTLADLERQLDPAIFFRISRAAIINLNAVEEVLPLVGGYEQVAMKDGARLEVSRRRMSALLDALQGTPHREL
jgi:two-component system LytT family response regulator